MFTWKTKIGLLSLLLLFEVFVAIAAPVQLPRKVRDYEWKMMSIVSGTYNWDTTNGSGRNSDLWATYVINQQAIKANIMRGKKLGFNSVRIPLYYIDPGSYPYYNHGWPRVAGSGRVVANPDYLSNINDLIGFCYENNMKVCLLLFVFGGQNEMIYYSRGDIPGHRNLSKYADADSVVSNTGIENWFTDAIAWSDYILSSIDQKQVAAYELCNEAGPSEEFRWIYHNDHHYITRPKYDPNAPYPYQPNNMFYLEMSNYLHLRWGSSFNLMISMSGVSDEIWQNLWYMLNHNFRRPSFLAGLNSFCGSSYQGMYFDILSIHDYHTYSSNIYFKTILSLEPYESHPYQWFIGEAGYPISSVTPDQYETDQEKYFQYLFQVARDLDSRLLQTEHPLKGLGLWSVLDYEMGFDDHYGIFSSENLNNVRKRKAASIVQQNLEGLVANPDFEIGPGNDMNFGDTEWCNGWTAYFPACCQEYHQEDYSYAGSSDHGHVLQLNPAPTREVGWSSVPGGVIRVKPNSKITVEVAIKVSDELASENSRPSANYFTDRTFVSLSWLDVNGRLISFSPIPPDDLFPANRWTVQSVVYEAPANAYYAAPYLMAWNSKYTVQFDSVQYIPEWQPAISFTFDDDITYFNLKPRNTMAGWWTSAGASSNQDGNLILAQWSIAKTTHYFANGGATALRMRQGNEYAAVGFISSRLAYFEAIGLQDAANEYPSLNSRSISKDTVSDVMGNIYSTSPISCDSGQSWMQVQFEDGGFGNTQVREVTVFEHVIDPAVHK